MGFRFRPFVLTILVTVFLLASGSSALEKTAAVFPGSNRDDSWRAGLTCSVVYYNYCTGWVWVWGGWSPTDVLGVCFDTCCPNGNTSSLLGAWVYVWTTAPSGYGFTGTIEVSAADADCCPAGTPLDSSPTLPISGWNFYDYTQGGSGSGITVPGTFALTYKNGPGVSSPISFPSDHPSVGPTGPQACGFCFPTTRATHSFFYGNATSPLCPGTTLNDGVCDAELFFDVTLACTSAIEPASWGKIKSLFR